MRLPASTRLLAALSAITLAAGGGTLAARASGPATPSDSATPDIACDAGSMTESTQGRAPLADYTSGRAADGYYCNAREIGHIGGTVGGYRVERYVDAAGHECAYWDSTLLFPNNLSDQAGVTGQTTVAGQTVSHPEGPGTYVTDMSDPANPVITDVLRTPAFQSPH